MEPARDTLVELTLIPWDDGHRGLALTWRSGLRETFPIWGEAVPLREKIMVSPEDGTRLLWTLQRDPAWDGDWHYAVDAGSCFTVELPTVVFQWFAEDASAGEAHAEALVA